MPKARLWLLLSFYASIVSARQVPIPATNTPPKEAPKLKSAEGYKPVESS